MSNCMILVGHVDNYFEYELTHLILEDGNRLITITD
jgi:hypothetical protein